MSNEIITIGASVTMETGALQTGKMVTHVKFI